MPRRVVLGGLLAAVVLCLLPTASFADTIDPAPVRSLSSTTGVNGVAVQPGTGRIFVSGADGMIRVFAPTATGSDAALYTLSPGCVPWQLTFNAAGTAMLLPCGTTVYEVDPASGATIHLWGGMTEPRAAVYTVRGGILVADRTGNRVWWLDAAVNNSKIATLDTQPSAQLANPSGITVTADGTAYVANNANDTVTVYEPLDKGLYPVVQASITLPEDVNQVQSVTLDDRGNLYVGGFSGGVLLYPPGANGAATPARRLVGPTSGDGTTQVALLADRSLLVGQYAAPRVAQFAALVPVEPPGAIAPPGAVTGLAVSGKKDARKRTITWAAGSAGSQPISSYAVVVARAGKTVLSTTTSGLALTLVAKKLKKSGHYTVSVTAANAVGPGPTASATFKVKLPKKRHGHHR